MFFSSPYDILRVAITAVILYFLLILILRLSGKRTLSSMNAFDFIVNVAIGTALASTILNSMVALSDGLTALVVLIGLQFLISYASSRSKKFSRFTKSEPKLLCYRGELLKGATKQERIADSDILQALRSSGYSSIGEVDAVVLESNGNISVIKSLEGKLPGVKS